MEQAKTQRRPSKCQPFVRPIFMPGEKLFHFQILLQIALLALAKCAQVLKANVCRNGLAKEQFEE